MELKNLNRDELVELLRAYDSYIQYANDNGRYEEGFHPVCMEEFYLCDFKYWKTDGQDS